jgi:predicted aldo/keto reductase-like oxidoreductase
METRNMGKGDVSLLGFGLMRLPTKGSYEEIDYKVATEMVDLAMESGINYFDTAYIYHGGNSEKFAKSALKRYERTSYRIADKMPLMAIKEKKDVDRLFNEQLLKCGVDFFDYYLLHGVQNHNVQMIRDFEMYEYMLKKKEEGFIVNIGFSFHDGPDLLKKVTEEHTYDFVQIQLNYLDWEVQEANEQYRILEERNIPVIVMEPVKGGILTQLSEEAVKILKEANHDVSVASWGFRYVGSLPGVQTVLSGMSNMDQLRDNIKTFSPFRPLDDNERKVISDALAAFKQASHVPCTSCRYCMNCPEGVEIPRNLAIYNDYRRVFANKHPMAGRLFQMQYNLLKENERASSCVSCGECAERCPQGIDIPHWMEDIIKLQKELNS